VLYTVYKFIIYSGSNVPKMYRLPSLPEVKDENTMPFKHPSLPTSGLNLQPLISL
jgi:hypothetical protein